MQIFVKTLTGKTSDEFRILIVYYNTSFLYIFIYKIYYCVWKGTEPECRRASNGGKFLHTHHMRIGDEHKNTPKRGGFAPDVYGTAPSMRNSVEL